MTGRAYALQRLSALVLIPLALGHLALTLYAFHDGLSAGEILSRTRGSVFWGLFYTAFVLAIGLHGTIGLQTILREWLALSRKAAGMAAGLVGLVLVIAGLYAVAAVVLP
jgi:fumarate reductase subunit C